MAFQQQAFEDYNKSSVVQRKINLIAAPYITEYLVQVEPLASSTLTILDYGCSEGFNSQVAFRPALEAVRRGSSKPIVIMHNDLGSNGWNTFFSTIYSSPECYLRLENIFPLAIGTSFYSQLCPSNYVHFGYSSLSFHFMSTIPACARTEHEIFYPESTAQVNRDARENLTHRLNELVVGGILCFTLLRNDPEHKSNYYMLLKIGLESVHLRGLITEEEWKNYRYCMGALSLDDWRDVIREFEGKFELLKIEPLDVSFPSYEQYLSDGNEEEYYTQIGFFFISIFKVLLFDTLSKRSQEERTRITTEAWNGLRAQILKPVDIIFELAMIVVKKIGN
jgi:hypothetical protein